MSPHTPEPGRCPRATAVQRERVDKTTEAGGCISTCRSPNTRKKTVQPPCSRVGPTRCGVPTRRTASYDDLPRFRGWLSTTTRKRRAPPHNPVTLLAEERVPTARATPHTDPRADMGAPSSPTTGWLPTPEIRKGKRGLGRPLRFPPRNFGFFSLYFQSSFHLSITVLLRYRSPHDI